VIETEVMLEKDSSTPSIYSFSAHVKPAQAPKVPTLRERAGWRIQTLGELCTLQRGFDLPTVERNAGKFPLVSAGGVIDTHDAAPVIGPGVVTGRSGTIGRVFYIEEPFWPLNTTLYVRDFHGNDPRFVYYLLLSFDLKKYAGGTGVPTLNRNDVHAVPILVPTGVAEQKRIVAILDEALDGIDVAKINTEKCLQNARAIFESHLQAIFTRRGDGYVERQLADVCAITSMLIDPRDAKHLDLTHIGAGNIESRTAELIGLKTAREENLISGKFLFDESMVLYSKIRPYLMKVARPNFNGLCSADMYPLAPLTDVISRDYLFYLLLSRSFTDYAIEGSARAGMPKVNREHLFQFRVWLPPLAEQKELSGVLDTLHEETKRLEEIYERKMAALLDLKNSLLHRAFNGNI